MCIIAFNPKGLPYDLRKMEIAYENNSHGFGLIWYEDGRMRMTKGLISEQEYLLQLRDLRGVPHALHLRWRTRGEINRNGCHPFFITKRDDTKLWMMHNGTIFKMPSMTTKSDSQLFAERLAESLKEHPVERLFDEDVLANIEKYVTSINKLLFVTSTGKFAIVNKSEWSRVDGILFSNTYSFNPTHREAKPIITSNSLVLDLSERLNQVVSERIQKPKKPFSLSGALERHTSRRLWAKAAKVSSETSTALERLQGAVTHIPGGRKNRSSGA